MKEIRKRLSIEGRDDWYYNPLTWICYGVGMMLAIHFGYVVAGVLVAILALPVNLEIEYERHTESFNTDTN